ncbi:hypothetical protein ABZT26_25875 [Streptomyces sp. NPDC005395]|uniref:hypothetical protein n=1 Tax=Streptomyces sp. NPDC005395 TaxID=3157042 RepID=UPI0033BF31F7
MTTAAEDMSQDEILARLEDHVVGWLAWHTGWDKPQKPYLDPTALRDNPTNRDSAAKYFQKTHDQAWEALGGYPGSDKHWLMLCLRCGWVGNMFNSHMRRDRRHKGCRPREFTPTGRLHLRFQVITNRVNADGGLGRLLVPARDELEQAAALEEAEPGGGQQMPHLRAALKHVQEAHAYLGERAELAPQQRAD